MAWRKVSALRGDSERRQTFRGVELDLDFAPFAVVGLVTWRVSENILIP